MTGPWDAVVDVSNVCWSDRLEPRGVRRPVLDRLDTVLAAWRRDHGDDTVLELVADRALLHLVDRDDARRLRRMLRDGELDVAPVADHVILQRARDRGLHILTGDHFLDFRRRHPWIEQEPQRFHHWTDTDGHVRFTALGVKPEHRHRVSLAEERQELKDDGLDPVRHRTILDTRWRCGAADCIHARLWQDQLLVWPRLTAGDRPVCPGCGGPLEALGPRGTIRQILVCDHESETEILRFPLEQGCSLVLGRGQIANGINLDGVGRHRPPEAVRYVSRQHVLLRLGTARGPDATPAVVAIDLGSSNGTGIERWHGTGYGPPQPLDPDVEVVLSPADRLVLGGGVRVEVSGRRFVADVHLPDLGAAGGRTTYLRDQIG